MSAADMFVNPELGWKLDWEYGTAQVQALGGMLGPVHLNVGDDRMLDVMHVAPWADGPATAALPGLMRRLRGEWPCVPFGRVDYPDGLPAGWSRRLADDTWDHGYAAHHAWQLMAASATHVHLAIDYPGHAPVRRIERVIRADPAAAALDISLIVHARRETLLPAGLHPTFALPGDAGRVEVLLGAHDGIFSYPTNADDGSARLAPDACSGSLARMHGLAGEVDFSRLPLPGHSEDLMQVRAIAGAGAQPPFALHYLDAQACVGLWWDTAQLPDLMLWVSNAGRAHFPWLGRHIALGAEPVNSLFDLGRVAVPPADHPLAGRTGILLTADQPWRTHYRIAAWADGQPQRG